ncbi:MAG: hypothetical protein C4534_05455 [Gaiellales bacterium]|nr:MAG: hypothetical protein C4534_05455 [Gaiellales bacterium]
MAPDSKLLLHICCAPCSTAAVAAWRAEGFDLAGTFFNPNIHPFAEHERRRETLMAYSAGIGLPLAGEPEYDVKAWLEMVRGREEKGERCRLCIGQRLRRTAETAVKGGFGAFSTTLLISPWQEHDIIQEEGERAAAAAGVAFLYRDLRPRYRESVELSRAAGLYRQNFCGCVFSEEEAARERHERKRK